MKNKTIEHHYVVEGLTDDDVGLIGEINYFSIEFPLETWNSFDDEDKKAFHKDMKTNVICWIDPDGKCYTAAEWDEMNSYNESEEK